MNQEIDIIYLDMDGVLVDNMSDLAEREGTSVDTIIREKRRLGQETPGFDLVVHLIRRHLYTGKHFENAEPLPHFPILKKLIRMWLSGGKRVEILSSGCTEHDTFDEICRQKDVWNDREGLEVLPRNYSRGSREKVNWARPGAVLIDDYDLNCEEWREAGGIAIQFTTIKNLIIDLQEIGLL